MPSATRGLSVLLVMVVALACSVGLNMGHDRPPGRWPTDAALFEVSGYSVDAGQVDVSTDPESTAVLLQRHYRNVQTGQDADLVVWSNPQPDAKQLFRKGPDRDYLGAGYTSERAPEGLVPAVPGGGAFIARQGDQAWLVLYMFGERRGALGDGPAAWFFGELDALLDRPNDYFLARVSVPYAATNSPPGTMATSLALTLFDRLTAWYTLDVPIATTQ
jgi:hypothetical protein